MSSILDSAEKPPKILTQNVGQQTNTSLKNLCYIRTTTEIICLSFNFLFLPYQYHVQTLQASHLLHPGLLEQMLS